MTALDSMRDVLQDPAKREPWAKRFEMLLVVSIMSASWIAAGYVWGHKSNLAELETLRAHFAKQREDLRESHGKKLEQLRTQCAAKASK